MSRTVMRMAALCVPVCLAGAAAALAQGGSYQRAALVLEQPRPGEVTPARLDIDYVDPANPSGKPPAVARVVETLPRGSRVDTSAPERCAASDAEFAEMGTAACPAGSRVGGGEVDLDSGAGVLHFDVTLFNNEGELILLLEEKDGGARTASRSKVEGSRPEGPQIVSEVPPIPGGPPDGFTAIKRVRLRVDAIARGGRRYVTTPPSCPAGGSWTSTLQFTYRNGTEQTVTNGSPCIASASAPAGSSPPRIAIRGLPRRCAARDFRVRIGIRDDSALRRAQVRLDGRVVRTTRRKRFGVRVRARRLRPGRHRLTVVARDASGLRGKKLVRFRRCR